jgi:hypothetical protein
LLFIIREYWLHYDSVKTKPEIGILNPSDVLMVFGVVSGPKYKMYPPEEADIIAPALIVPQFDVAVPKSIKLAFDLTPADVAVQLPDVLVTDWRAYAVPDVETSVPPPEDVGAVVNKAMYTVPRRV